MTQRYKMFPFLFSMMLLALGCQFARRSNELPPNTGGRRQSASPSASASPQSASNHISTQKELQDRYDAMQQMLKHASATAKITNLKDKLLSNPESEIRIWVGFGLAIPNCFILRSVNEESEAFYITPKIIGDRAAMDSRGEILMEQLRLDRPQSDWAQFRAFLAQQGIDLPIKISLDEKHIYDPDEGAIVIEIKSGAAYGMVFFPLFTESADGQKMLNVCHRIEQDFRIRMGCREGK